MPKIVSTMPTIPMVRALPAGLLGAAVAEFAVVEDAMVSSTPLDVKPARLACGRFGNAGERGRKR